MMNTTPDAAHRRKGIFLLVMPLILLPILFLLLYNSEPVSAEQKESGNGMNLEMPKPILANRQESKSEAYVHENEALEEKNPWGLSDFLVDRNQSEKFSGTGLGSEPDQFRFSSVSAYSSSSGKSPVKGGEFRPGG